MLCYLAAEASHSPTRPLLYSHNAVRAAGLAVLAPLTWLSAFHDTAVDVWAYLAKTVCKPWHLLCSKELEDIGLADSRRACLWPGRWLGAGFDRPSVLDAACASHGTDSYKHIVGNFHIDRRPDCLGTLSLGSPLRLVGTHLDAGDRRGSKLTSRQCNDHVGGRAHGWG